MSIKALSDYTQYAKYARYLPDKKRRETWNEQVDRVFNMHEVKLGVEKLKLIQEDFDFAKDMVKKRKVLGSQRALQFGGSAILKKQAKIYNCTVSYVDRVDFFKECMYLLLCGCGVGFSVQTHHIAKLPNIVARDKGEETFVIPDTIEGWSDAIGVLVQSYFDDSRIFTMYDYKVEYSSFSRKKVNFDFSLIRPEGSPIAWGGKAPGPKGLQNAIINIEKVFETALSNGKTALCPIDAYDIIMHSSDAVLSGGIRRSATICLFSPDDMEMSTAKTGDWFIKNPQRGRSNNSALLVRNKTTKEQFSTLMKSVKEFGEPGFIWADDTEVLFNPCCVSSETEVMTTEGPKKVKDLIGINFVAVVNGKQYKVTSNGFFSSGKKELFKLVTKEGYEIDLTNDHKILTENRSWVEAGQLTSSDEIVINHHENINWNGRGDNKLGLSVGRLLIDGRIEVILDDILNSSSDFIKGFLTGWFDVNGNVTETHEKGISVNLPSTFLTNLKIAQRMLLRLGIMSTIHQSNTNHELVISCKSLFTFKEVVGFKNIDKQTLLEKLISNYKRNPNKDKFIVHLESFEPIGEEEVYDCTVEDIHAFDANGIYVHNCEIGFYAYDEVTGKSGFSFCNLCEINGRKAVSEQDFLEMCRAAAIIGTIQASYDTFDYLEATSESIVKREALLGVSMTGMMDNPQITFDPEIQQKGAKLILDINESIAVKIGINKCARATCVKPAGTTSCILGSASGVHPHHAKRYMRRVQANKLEFPVQHFAKLNPKAVEESVWSNNNTDLVINFLCEVPDGAKTKNQVNAISLLEYVKTTQQNWVEYGTRKDWSVKPWLRHNVSNTINVKDDEWDGVEKYIYENRQWFAGISLIPASGDLDYPQAPFVTVLNEKELVHQYGEGTVFASGLVVDGLKAFNDNLWTACDTANGIGETLIEGVEPIEPIIPIKNGYTNKEWSSKLVKYASDLSDYNTLYEEYEKNCLKIDWIRRFKQFAVRYCHSDIRKCSHMIKHVYVWKQWLDIKRDYVDIDWSIVKEDQYSVDVTAIGGEACSGPNGCEVGDLGRKINEKKLKDKAS